MRIVISSGHGKYVSGAVGILNEVEEARKIVPKVAEYLKMLGETVIIFNDDVSRNQRDNLNAIVKFHNSYTRDLDVSVHLNAAVEAKVAQGAEVLYVSDGTRDLAAKVSNAIAISSGLPNRGPKKRTDLAFLNGTKMPAILIEVCFVTSSEDVKLYKSAFDKICRAIAETISGKKIATNDTKENANDSTLDENDRIIWDFFKKRGLNDFAVAGLMGNLYAESGLNPKNLQNGFEKKFSMTDATYTAAVDSGDYENFVDDGAGYGLAQWTYHSRKESLYQYARLGGKSIGDLKAQLEFLWHELQSYTDVIKILKSAKSVRESSDIVLLQFERPADQSVAVQTKRAGFGEMFYNKFCEDEKSPEAITVENALADGILSDGAYWLGVLTGRIDPSPKYVKVVLDNAHNKISETHKG